MTANALGRAAVLDELVLVAITDLEQTDFQTLLARWETLAQQARPRSVAIDLRAPARPAREIHALGEALKQIALRHDQRLIVNDRIDLALLLDAHALHLREDSVNTATARHLVGNLPILRACHNVGDVALVDADAVLLSPVIEARKGNAPLGVESLRIAKEALIANAKPTKLFALGGVDAARAPSCLQAGADGVAAIGAALGEAPVAPFLRALGIERTR